MKRLLLPLLCLLAFIPALKAQDAITVEITRGNSTVEGTSILKDDVVVDIQDRGLNIYANAYFQYNAGAVGKGTITTTKANYYVSSYSLDFCTGSYDGSLTVTANGNKTTCNGGTHALAESGELEPGTDAKFEFAASPKLMLYTITVVLKPLGGAAAPEDEVAEALAGFNDLAKRYAESIPTSAKVMAEEINTFGAQDAAALLEANDGDAAAAIAVIEARAAALAGLVSETTGELAGKKVTLFNVSAGKYLTATEQDGKVTFVAADEAAEGSEWELIAGKTAGTFILLNTLTGKYAALDAAGVAESAAEPFAVKPIQDGYAGLELDADSYYAIAGGKLDLAAPDDAAARFVIAYAQEGDETAYTVNFTVTAGGNAVAGATLTAGDVTATTGADGTAALTVKGYAGSIVTVTIATEDYPTVVKAIYLDSETEIAVAVELTPGSIEAAVADTTAAQYYDLNGRPVNAGTRGIIITNGRKILVR